MEENDNPKSRKQRAVAGFLCCCSCPADTLEPGSSIVRVTAGIVAIIAMLASGIGFSALQRATINPYEHLFTAGSSSRQHMTPSAWGPAFAPAPVAFLQPILQPFGGFASAEGTSQGAPEQMFGGDQTGPFPGALSGTPIGGLSGSAMAPSAGLAHNSIGSSTGASIRTASGPSQSTASIESASPELSSLGVPEMAPAQFDAASNGGATGKLINQMLMHTNDMCVEVAVL